MSAPTAQVCPERTCIPKVCVAVPDVKKTKKVAYSCKLKEYCLPKFCFSGCCDAFGRCGKVRTVNVLLKKSVTEEHPTFKCVVQEAADCRIPFKKGCPPLLHAPSDLHRSSAVPASGPPRLK